VEATQVRPAVYRYRLEFFDDERRPLHELALAPADFGRAVEAAFFDGLRRGVFTEYNPPLGRARLEPRFKKNDGSPRAAGFTVVLPAPDGREHRADFPSSYFASRATLVGAQLVRDGKKPEDGRLLFQLAAYLDGAADPPRRGLRIAVEEPSVEVPIRAGSRRALGVAEAWDEPSPDDFPVVIPRHVLEEAVEEAKRAPEREVGGVLLGHLRRDPDNGELFLQVTCQVPAEQTQATTTSVTFTPETWARVREVIDLRGEGEIFAGWVHSHPFRFCKDCPTLPPPECVSKVLFYSADDEFLMELSFARPFMVGLLTAVETKLERVLGHLPVRLFGWHNGEIRPRGFEVIDEK
jgi:proteasome lid subunit RPN8/RPN11